MRTRGRRAAATPLVPVASVPVDAGTPASVDEFFVLEGALMHVLRASGVPMRDRSAVRRALLESALMHVLRQAGSEVADRNELRLTLGLPA